MTSKRRRRRKVPCPSQCYYPSFTVTVIQIWLFFWSKRKSDDWKFNRDAVRRACRARDSFGPIVNLVRQQQEVARKTGLPVTGAAGPAMAAITSGSNDEPTSRALMLSAGPTSRAIPADIPGYASGRTLISPSKVPISSQLRTGLDWDSKRSSVLTTQL